MNISKLSIQAEIDGTACFILIPDGVDEMVIKFIAGFSKDRKLQAVKAPDGFKFQSIAELAGQSE